MIDFDTFVEWAENRLGDIRITGEEIRANSIFHPTRSDTKFRLWMKPSGDTKKGERHDGVYHCFDTDQKGTLIGLVMIVDKCSYGDACVTVGGGGNLAKLEQKVREFFENKPFTLEELQTTLTLPPSIPLTYKSTDYTVIDACLMLEKRKIPLDGLFLGTEGKYKNRIIIPYYDRDGNLIYFNTRAMGKGAKYLGPEKDIGVGKDDVIYMHQWPKLGEKVYLTEGEFDAMTLNLCGFYGAAVGGKNLSEKQIGFLKGYDICLALDSDKAGKTGLMKMYHKFRENGVLNMTYITPPKTNDIKDWNSLYQETDTVFVQTYIERNEKKLTERDFFNMSFEFIKV